MKETISLICCGMPHSDEEQKALLQRVERGAYPPVMHVFAGKSVCCRDTATLLYPNAKVVLLDELRPFDYGDFAHQPIEELEQTPEFWDWMCAKAVTPCPNGGDPYQYQKACVKAFVGIEEEMSAKDITDAAVIVHAEFIAMVMREYAQHHPLRYGWEIQPGGGFVLERDFERESLRVLQGF